MSDLEINTWRDLKDALSKLTEAQLDQKAQVVQSEFDDDKVCECKPIIAIGTVDDLGFEYIRSAFDNQRHGSDFVLLCDDNAHAEDGAIAYNDFLMEEQFPGKTRLFFEKLFPSLKAKRLAKVKESAIYHKDHDDRADWTGPAQKIWDSESTKRLRGAETTNETLVCKSRTKDFDDRDAPLLRQEDSIK